MTWDYRIIRRGGPAVREFFCVHRVYHEDDVVFAVEETPAYPSAESIEDLEEEIRRMREAFQKPVLDYDDL
jgi:hypothetical protein